MSFEFVTKSNIKENVHWRVDDQAQMAETNWIYRTDLSRRINIHEIIILDNSSKAYPGLYISTDWISNGDVALIQSEESSRRMADNEKRCDAQQNHSQFHFLRSLILLSIHVIVILYVAWDIGLPFDKHVDLSRGVMNFWIESGDNKTSTLKLK